MKLRVLDLFAGIGGFSLGLERTGGFETVAFCEFDRKAQKVLAKHWPDVPIYNDVRELTADQLRKDGISVDVITGGFPCQDISSAGKRAGLAGERSGLWYEFKRLIEEIRPQWAIIENVSALRSRGLDQVLRGLAEIGYDAEWHCIPASAVGAPHQRDRIWIVAYPTSPRLPLRGRSEWQEGAEETGAEVLHEPERCREDVADSYQPRLEGWLRAGLQECSGELPAGQGGTRRLDGFWATEPDVGRVADGVPGRVDRLKQLGNAVVPHIPELIGYAILEHNTIGNNPRNKEI